MDTAASMLYVTCPSEAEARAIGRALVEQRLAACANILTHVQSIYHWQGDLCEDNEVVLVAKTRQDLADQAQALILSRHSYDCPCVVQLPIIGGNPAFLDWIADETTSQDTPDTPATDA